MRLKVFFIWASIGFLMISCSEEIKPKVRIVFSDYGSDFGNIPTKDLFEIGIGDSLQIPDNIGFLGKKRHVFKGWILKNSDQKKIFKPGEVLIIESQNYEFIPYFINISEVAVLIFTFDDGIRSDLEIVYPIFQKYGISGTSFVIGFRGEEKWSENYMTFNDWKYLSEKGCDIQCHSYSHISLKNLSEQEIIKELERMNDLFNKLNLPVPLHHALPFGHYNQNVLDVIWKYRKSIRFYKEEGINDHIFQSGNYNFLSFKGDVPYTNSLPNFYNFVDELQDSKAVGLISIHAVEGDRSSPFNFKISKENLEKLLDYVIEKDEVEILSLSQYMKIVLDE